MGPTTRLFIYGTLADPDVQQRIIGRLVPVIPAVLEGYMRGEVEIGSNTYPRIEPMAGESVAGGVIELTEAELIAVDAYEGAEYVRQRVTLQDDSQADTYIKPT